MNNDRLWTPVEPSADSPIPRGNYSPAIVAGDFIFTSGQIPIDPATGSLLSDAGVEEQTLQVLENVRAVVEAAGGRPEDVVAVTVYLSDINHWGVFNRVFGEFFTPPYPTRTVIGAQMKGFDVEATAIAVRRSGGAAERPSG